MRRAAFIFTSGLLFACAKGGGETQHPQMGALPVALDTLERVEVHDYDQYLAALTSRRSVDLFPQVSAYVKQVAVNPGDRVKQGQVLLRLDTGEQRAKLRSIEATLETEKANLAYAVKNDESARQLVKTGVLSQLDYQQRHAQRVAAEARVRAARAQVAAQQNLLDFYTIEAPTAGVVGDVPVKVGEYVTPQTNVTSITQNSKVEAYVYVPVAKASAITPATRIVLFDPNGCEICDEQPTFVSQAVDPNTQSVLVKTLCPNSGRMREAEVLRARVVWQAYEGLEVPVTAVTHTAGQYFVFVATQGQHGLTAEQRPIQIGEIKGNAYVVQKGLEPGDQVITSSVQKLRPGMPVKPAPAHPSAPAGSAGAAPPASASASASASAGVRPAPVASSSGTGGGGPCVDPPPPAPSGR